MKARAGSRRREAVIAAAIATLGLALSVAAPPAGAATDPSEGLPANATWLQTLNAWRAASREEPVTENTTWSVGDAAHSKYVVESGDFGHDEDEGGPFATVDGALAGANGNVAASTDATKSDRRFVEQWINAPFHAAGMLDPMLNTSGFGAYRKPGATPWPAAATLDVIRGRGSGTPATAIQFPGDTSILPATEFAYRGGESPDPVSPCPGYEPAPPAQINTGVPLFLLLQHPPVADSMELALTREGTPVESCVYDETTYTNPDSNAQTLGREVLASRHQVVIVPRAPLSPGAKYRVEGLWTDATTMLQSFTGWSFLTRPEVSIGNVSVVEGQTQSRSIRLTVSLSGPSTNPVTVNYATAPGTATAGTDYISQSGTVTIAPGLTSAQIAVTVRGDRTVEPNESFKVNLSKPHNADFGRSSGGVTIVTDDRAGSPNPGIQASIGAAAVVEGNADIRALRFTVGLSTAPTSAVTLHYAALPGTASAGSDFGPASGTVSIGSGSTTAVVSVRIKGDFAVEPTETFTVQLSNAVGATINRASAVGTILDDD